jgi:hypothetical protein
MKRAMLVLLGSTLLLPMLQAAGQTKSGLTAKAAVAAPAASGGSFAQIDFNWGYSPNLPACAGRTEACHTGFTMTNTTTNTVVATPSTLGPAALSFNYLPAGGVPFGTFVYSLVANGFNETGTPITSTPATVTVVIPVTSLNGPTGLTGKLQ